MAKKEPKLFDAMSALVLVSHLKHGASASRQVRCASDAAPGTGAGAVCIHGVGALTFGSLEAFKAALRHCGAASAVEARSAARPSAQPPSPGCGPWPEPWAAAPPQVALTPYDTLYVDRELGTAALTPGELKGWGGEDVLDLYRRLGELFEQSNKGDPEALKANPYVGICSHLTSLQ